VVPEENEVVVPPTPGVPRTELPDIALPVHGVEEIRLGGETVVIGLTPPLITSVEPSGTVSPESGDPAVVLGIKSGDAMPGGDAVPVPVGDTAGEDPEVQPPEDIAPPSKAAPIEFVVMDEPADIVVE
jgi:hypothetical protein